MTVLRRRAWTLAALAAVFGTGWAAGHASSMRGLARPDVAVAAAGAASPGASTPSCTDRLAMEANANLVREAHDYHSRLALAELRAKEADLARAKVVDGPPARLVAPPAEWRRMAREGTIRVRVPCSRPDASSQYIVHRVNEGFGVSSPGHAGDMESRTRAAGLSPDELDAIAEAYARAHSRTWAAMRSTCEANAAFRIAMEDHREDDISDEQRVDLCSSTILDIDDPSARGALTRVAELHAAGAGIDRTTTSEQRVAFALTSAPTALYDEMVRAVGREKATRAIDNGILCLDETLFDLHESAPEPEDD